MREFIVPFGSYVIHLNFISPHAFEMKFSNKSSESIKYMGLGFYRMVIGLVIFIYLFKLKFCYSYYKV